MFKRLLLLVSILLLAGAPNVFASVGVFDFTADIGNPLGIGSTQYVPVDRYLITAGGGDIWGEADQFHYACKEVSGDVRISMSPSWQTTGWNDWAKNGVMLRETLDAGSVHYSTVTRKGGGDPWSKEGYIGDSVFGQRREGTGWGSAGYDGWGLIPHKLGVQRLTTSSGYEVVQSLVDQGGGAGWEAVWTGLRDLPDNILAGVAVTAHDNAWLVQAYADDVQYESNPGLIGVTQIGGPLGVPCGDTPGFRVSVAHMPIGWTFWGERNENYEQAEWLVKNDGMVDFPDGFGPYPGADATEMGSRIVELVNLADGEGTGAGAWDFTAPDFPDERFPGVDEFPNDWVNLEDDIDGDDQFAVLVEGCIELTEGLHVIGGSFDDGLLIRIGGVEIGRNVAWDERSAFFFEAPVAGIYEFEAIGYEIGGGAFLEIVEYLPDGSKVLLNDVANGASAVFIPEPATIALLGFGGLSMLRIRRKR